MAMCLNVGYLHGGINLYNNGFSGGFVAAVLAPLLEDWQIRKNKGKTSNLENKVDRWFT